MTSPSRPMTLSTNSPQRLSPPPYAATPPAHPCIDPSARIRCAVLHAVLRDVLHTIVERVPSRRGRAGGDDIEEMMAIKY